ncbi:hypothetical protein Mapa_012541 [Marchantia paleacea]|nr:hypothetical protein Mapa_012541 [Marchantia paleacea]
MQALCRKSSSPAHSSSQIEFYCNDSHHQVPLHMQHSDSSRKRWHQDSNALLASVVLLATLYTCAAKRPYAAGHSENFSHKTCSQAASIVDAYVTKFLKKDRNFAGAFNRLQFHDCWVGGCDGSVLLNSTATIQAEREAHVNFGLRGVAEIDEIKAVLKHFCPGVVSCADILIMAAPLGRRDGVQSTDLMADTNLPFPVLNFSGLVANFAAKGFSAREMITLSSLGIVAIDVLICMPYVKY